MSLALTLAIVAVLDVMLLGVVVFVMTRPSKLEPHLSFLERIHVRRRQRMERRGARTSARGRLEV